MSDEIFEDIGLTFKESEKFETRRQSLERLFKLDSDYVKKRMVILERLETFYQKLHKEIIEIAQSHKQRATGI